VHEAFLWVMPWNQCDITARKSTRGGMNYKISHHRLRSRVTLSQCRVLGKMHILPRELLVSRLFPICILFTPKTRKSMRGSILTCYCSSYYLGKYKWAAALRTYLTLLPFDKRGPLNLLRIIKYYTTLLIVPGGVVTSCDNCTIFVGTRHASHC
jgi:hypothetical protein